MHVKTITIKIVSNYKILVVYLCYFNLREWEDLWKYTNSENNNLEILLEAYDDIDNFSDLSVVLRTDRIRIYLIVSTKEFRSTIGWQFNRCMIQTGDDLNRQTCVAS